MAGIPWRISTVAAFPVGVTNAALTSGSSPSVSHTVCRKSVVLPVPASPESTNTCRVERWYQSAINLSAATWSAVSSVAIQSLYYTNICFVK